MKAAHLAALMLLLASSANAQKPVYRCETNGKIEYSHAPCVGAIEIDTTPTRGMDKSSGRSMKSQELRSRELQEAIAMGTKPLHGMETDKFIKTGERSKLPAKDQAECKRLDTSLPEKTGMAARATGAEKSRADVLLYQSRKRYNDLNC